MQRDMLTSLEIVHIQHKILLNKTIVGVHGVVTDLKCTRKTALFFCSMMYWPFSYLNDIGW